MPCKIALMSKRDQRKFYVYIEFRKRISETKKN